MTLRSRVLYTCPCGREVIGVVKRADPKRHQDYDAIVADLGRGMAVGDLRAKYKLTRNQAAGQHSRFWAKVRERSNSQ